MHALYKSVVLRLCVGVHAYLPPRRRGKPQFTIRVPWYRLFLVDFIYYLILKKCIHKCKAFLHCMSHDKLACFVLIDSIYSNKCQ